MYINYYDIERMEHKVNSVMRRYPVIALIGLCMTVALFMTVGKPVIAYAVNAIQRMNYKSAFYGTEGTELAQQTWKELIAELNAISEMGFIGEMLVEMPICRMAVMLVAMFALIVSCYFAFHLYEAAIDYRVLPWIIYGVCEVVKGLRIIARALVFWFCVAVFRTFYIGRKMFRKGQNMYRSWESNRYQPRFLKEK